MANKEDIYLKDLELQWQDHHHMRDQTWKTLTNSFLILIALVGMEIMEIDIFIVIVTSFALLINSIFGYALAVHHRLRQKEKFAYIRKYEELLGLRAPEVKGEIRDYYKKMTFNWYEPNEFANWLVNKVNTADFIKWIHVIVFFIAILFLFK
jgi:hypothetical protein